MSEDANSKIDGTRKKTGGRQAGTPNKTTAQIKEAISAFISNNSDKLDQWIAEVDDPAKRIDLYFKAMEYAVPKLARTEHVGDENQPIKHVVKFED